MARIFVSYSRADRQFVDEFVPLLYRVYGKESLWFDDDITGGETWWPLILSQIQGCELFIYLLSNDALTSPYCQAELREALRLHKRVLPVIVRPKTQIDEQVPEDLRTTLQATQWVDLSRGFKDYQANASLYAAINHSLEQALPPDVEPLSPEPVSKPEVLDKPVRRQLVGGWGVVAMMLLALVGITLFIITQNPGSLPTEQPAQPTATTSVATQVVSEPTLDLRAAALATRDAGLTQTAALWTATPTPDVQQTIAVQLTAIFIEDQTAMASVWTDTPTPSDTPTNTSTPTMTTAPTSTPDLLQIAQAGVQRNADWQPFSQNFNGVEMVLVPAGSFMMGSSAEQIEAAFQQCEARVGQCERSWLEDESPQTLITFSQPFWIDLFEVTNRDFDDFVKAGGYTNDAYWTEAGSAWRNTAGPNHTEQTDRIRTTPYEDCTRYSNSDKQPVNCITWYEAGAYCRWRGARLPTEAEWEYTARGPDSLIYPWGNEFVPDNSVYYDNSGDKTAIVGSKPKGMSWVGAMDMSGNVWEWVSTAYAAYPYDPADGREDMEGPNVEHVVRGGRFIDYLEVTLRVAYRNNFISSDAIGDGFRCALSS